MSRIFWTTTTKTDSTRRILEAVRSFMSPQGTQTNSQLENTFDTIRVMDTKDIPTRGPYHSKDRGFKSRQFNHTTKLNPNTVPLPHGIRVEGIFISVIPTRNTRQHVRRPWAKKVGKRVRNWLQKIGRCQAVHNFVELRQPTELTTVVQRLPAKLLIYLASTGPLPGTSDRKRCLVL